jgi:RNA polymerase sigma-70 factor (ECF subfamily)
VAPLLLKNFGKHFARRIEVMMPRVDESFGRVGTDFENLVNLYYQTLHQFAFALTQSEADASDLTQQTFYVWATKGGQLRDASKVKTWLFTTLHRAFLQTRRKRTRFPHYELGQVEAELPELSPVQASRLDTAQLSTALCQMDSSYQEAVTLFYLEDCPYKEIARILGVPLGTVKSRIARGLAQLHRLLAPESRTNSRSCN